MDKKKAVIFGAGGTGRRVYNMIKSSMDVTAFVDNDPDKWEKELNGVSIMNPEVLRPGSNGPQYDVVVLGTLMGLTEVQGQLEDLAVPMSQLDRTYVEISVMSRNFFCKRFAERVMKQGLEGAVAEAGVFRGEFAKEINRYFFDRRCYLFDTFEGFAEEDFPYEEKRSLIDEAAHLKMTSEEFVYQKMPHKENVIMKKGHFPDTAADVEDQFVFVNLDMDLYWPTLEGLKFFYPRLCPGGVILIHDYFSEAYPNVEKAVDDFEAAQGLTLHKMPVGDDISLAIIK